MRFLLIFLILFVVFRIVSFKPVYKDGDRIRITGKVSSEPIRYPKSQRVSLAGLKFYLPLYPEINYGDKIIVEGVVENGELEEPVLIRVEESSKFLFKLRRKLVEFYQKSLPEPHAALVSGVTLGSKASLPEEFWESLKTTGTAHVVVASGMNVSLVAGFLMGFLLLFLPRGKAIFLALAGVWAYSLISGFEAPIVRAAVMGSLAFIAQALGRLYSAGRALVLSALAMLVINPSWIMDLGFILSFVATASLMIFEKKIRGLVYFVPGFFREGLSTSLAAQIGVAPILFVTFGQFNLFSPLVNAIVLWTIAPITIIGMIGGVVGLFVPFLGRLILLITYPLTSWFIWMVYVFG